MPSANRKSKSSSRHRKRVGRVCFKIIETLFEVTHPPRPGAPVWNAAVAFYRIERNGQLVGQFYLDQPARTGKRGGAWMDDVRTRWLRPDTGVLQTPGGASGVQFCRWRGRQATAAHARRRDHPVSRVWPRLAPHADAGERARRVSGIGGVEWDAVELPSQFMENFCWEWRRAAAT
jgi:oligopeptidase A